MISQLLSTHLSIAFFTLLAIVFLFIGPAFSAIATRYSLPVRQQLILLGICILYGLSPILVALVGTALAERFGCETNPTILYRCPGNPQLGNFITVTTQFAWAIFVTVPSGIAGLIGFIVSLTLKIRRSQTGEPSTPFFYRSRRHRVLAGICGAIAQRSGFPSLSIRIIAVVIAIVGTTFIVPIYLWLWVAFPPEPIEEE